MKKLIFSLSILLNSILFSQNLLDNLGNKNYIAIKGYDYIDGYVQAREWDKLLEVIEEQNVFPEKVNTDNNVYLLFNGIKNENELVVLHTKNGEPTERFIEQENFYIIWIDDNIFDDHELFIEVKERESFLERDFSNIKSWFSGGLRAEQEYRDTTYYYFFNVRKIERMVIPSDINITFTITNGGKEQFNRTYSYVNHEISYFNVALGVTVASIQEQSLLIKSSQLYVSDKAKKEWQGKFILGFNFHPGRDVDAWNPNYKFWEGNFFDEFYKRLNLFIGIEISSKPFDALFAGLGISITKDIQLNTGAVFLSTTRVSGGEDVGEFKSLDDVKKFFPSKYEPQFYFGLSFTTSAVSSMLGLKK